MDKKKYRQGLWVVWEPLETIRKSPQACEPTSDPGTPRGEGTVEGGRSPSMCLVQSGSQAWVS